MSAVCKASLDIHYPQPSAHVPCTHIMCKLLTRTKLFCMAAGWNFGDFSHSGSQGIESHRQLCSDTGHREQSGAIHILAFDKPNVSCHLSRWCGLACIWCAVYLTSTNYEDVPLTDCRGSTWRRLGPTIVLLVAIPLTAADPLRHVLQGLLFRLHHHVICT